MIIDYMRSIRHRTSSLFFRCCPESTTAPGDTTVSVKKVAAYNLQKSSQVNPWTEHKYQKLTGIQSLKEGLMYLTNSFVQVHDFVFIESPNAKYLLVELMDPELLEQNKILYHLVSLNDGILVKTVVSTMWLLDSKEDVVYFYYATESSVSIKTYRFVGGQTE